MPRYDPTATRSATRSALPHGLCPDSTYCVEHRQDRRVPSCKKQVSPVDGLFRLFVYHHADLNSYGARTPDERRRCVVAAVNGKLLPPGTGPDDTGKIAEYYNDFVQSYGEDVLPRGWRDTHDYWGGRCFAYKPGWAAPKSGTIAAGESGSFLAFDSFDAMKEYFAEKVDELEREAEREGDY